jgi:hypothetical protein
VDETAEEAVDDAAEEAVDETVEEWSDDTAIADLKENKVEEEEDEEEGMKDLISIWSPGGRLPKFEISIVDSAHSTFEY